MKIVYIIKSLKDKGSYIGNTGNLDERLKRHNSGKVGSTKHRVPFELVCYFVFHDNMKAYDFERYLKSGSGRAFMKRHFS